MYSSVLVKTVAAFIAGLVIALGGVLIFHKTKEMASPEPEHTAAAVQQVPAAAPAPATATSQDRSDATNQTLPTPANDETRVAAPSKKVRTPTRRPGIARDTAAAAQQQQPAQPVATTQVAQDVPPPNPTAPQLNGSAQNGNLQNPTNVPSPAENAQAAVPPPSPPPPPQPRTVTLPAGTNLAIRLGETLSTDKNYAGDTFRATLDSPVIVDGFVIAEKGSKVLGKVVDAQKAGRVKGVAQLQLAVTEINTTDGQRIRVQTGTWDKQGPKSTGQDAAKIGAGAVLGTVIGAIAGGGKGAAIGAGAGGAAGTGAVLATRGKDAKLPVETRLTFRLQEPVRVTEKLNR